MKYSLMSRSTLAICIGSMLLIPSTAEDKSSATEVKKGQIIQLNELVLVDDITTYKGEPFTGYAEERYTQMGNFKRQANYLDGKMHGKVTDWHANGKKGAITNYHKGRVTGIELAWYSNGQLKAEEPHQKGYLEGTVTRWHENGQIKAKENFLKGVPHGLHQRWDTEGKLVFNVIYDNGKPVSQ